jgi:hypothetical protein
MIASLRPRSGSRGVQSSSLAQEGALHAQKRLRRAHGAPRRTVDSSSSRRRSRFLGQRRASHRCDVVLLACEVMFLAHGIDSLGEKSDGKCGMPALNVVCQRSLTATPAARGARARTSGSGTPRTTPGCLSGQRASRPASRQPRLPGQAPRPQPAMFRPPAATSLPQRAPRDPGTAEPRRPGPTSGREPAARSVPSFRLGDRDMRRRTGCSPSRNPALEPPREQTPWPKGAWTSCGCLLHGVCRSRSRPAVTPARPRLARREGHSPGESGARRSSRASGVARV